jgi:hypothetical protein
MGKLSAAVRRRTATVHQPNRKKGQKHRFPMPDKKHARLALQMLGRAKGLSSSQKARIRARANRMLGKKR